MPLRIRLFFPLFLFCTLCLSSHSSFAAQPVPPGFYIDLIKTDPSLFGITIARFTPTQKQELLFQYFTSNLKKNADKFGAIIEIIEIYRKERLSGSQKGRLAKLQKWLKSLEPGKELSAAALAKAQLYLLVRAISMSTDKLDPKSSEVTILLAEASKLRELDPKDPWSAVLQALAIQSLRKRNVEAGSTTPPLALLARASLLATQDGHIHYVLANLYLQILDSSDVATYVKLVTAEYEKCLLLQPSNRELFTRVTGVYVDIHERFQSINVVEPFWFEELVYKRIIALDPTNAQAHNNLSFLYSTLGVNLKQALREARIANQLKPDNAYLQDTLGWAFYRNGMLQDALRVLKKAVASKPELADIHFHLASVYYDLDEFAPTVKHFREAIRLDPKNAFARNNLAYFFAVKNRNIDEALRLVSEALVLSPDSAAFLDTKGWILYRLGRHDEALPFIRKALSLSPETSELHLHLGQVLLARKEFKESIRAFEHALAYDPQNKEIARRLSRLFALHSLETTLKAYAHISGVRSQKENFKIFYDLMARIHMDDNNYEQAMALMREYHSLRSGSLPARLTTTAAAVIPATTEGLTVTETPATKKPDKVLPELSAEAAKWQKLARFNGKKTDFIFGLTNTALLKMVDVALGHYKTPVPAAMIKGLLASRLPGKVLVGFSLAKPIDSATILVALQFPDQAMQMVRQRLNGLSGTTMDVPASGMKVSFSQQSYKKHALGKISLPFGAASYLFPSKNIMLISSERSSLVKVIDALTDKNISLSPAFFESKDWLSFGRYLDSKPDLMTFAITPHGKQLTGLKLSESYKNLIDKTSSVGTTYRILPFDTVSEKSLVIPFPGIDPTKLHQPLTGVVEDFKSRLITTTNGSVTCTSSFQAGQDVLEGSAEFKGIQKWIIKILSSMAGLNLPVDGLNRKEEEK